MKKPNRIALWIDTASARFFVPFGDVQTIQTLHSGIDLHPRDSGVEANGSGWNNRFSTNEFKKDQRERELFKQYFHQVQQILLPYEEILLLGPGQIKKELSNQLLRQHQFQDKSIALENAGTLSERQFVEWVNRYFETMDAGKLRITPSA
jgi:stalled ribosome rescue protein Dom34